MLGNRPVALKVLSRKLLDDPEFLQRFHNEAASTARIQHPSVVTIYESGQADDGTPYIAMEYLKGEPLREALRRGGTLPLAECVEILQQAARGLNAAHKLGIIHRDLKPDNLFLTRGDEGELIVKIVDFGIAKLRESATHTLTGMVLGTPAYMSSEQAAGMRSDELDARSDLYSLGIVTYEMLTGRVPFHSDTPLGYLRKHMMDPPPPFRAVKPDLPAVPEVERVVMKALAKDRDERYGSVLDFSREFTRAAMPPAHAELPKPLAPTKAAEPANAEVGAVREPPLPARGTPVPPGAQTVPRSEVGASGAQPEAERRSALPPGAPTPSAAPTAPAGDVGASSTRPGAEGRSALPPVGAHAPTPDVGAVREPPLRDSIARPQPRKKSRAASASVIAAVAVVIVLALVWVYWPSHAPPPNPAPQETTVPAKPQPSAPAPSVNNPSVRPPTPRSVPVTDRAELRKKVNAAITEGDYYYDNGEYDRAISTYQGGLAADPGNAQLREKIRKAKNAKTTESSAPQ
jgi:serine/threonine-protein kinase